MKLIILLRTVMGKKIWRQKKYGANFYVIEANFDSGGELKLQSDHVRYLHDLCQCIKWFISINYYWYSFPKFFLLIGRCVLNWLLLKNCARVGKGILLYIDLKIYGLGLDKLSASFLEWEIGKVEAAKFCD